MTGLPLPSSAVCFQVDPLRSAGQCECTVSGDGAVCSAARAGSRCPPRWLNYRRHTISATVAGGHDAALQRSEPATQPSMRTPPLPLAALAAGLLMVSVPAWAIPVTFTVTKISGTTLEALGRKDAEWYA